MYLKKKVIGIISLTLMVFMLTFPVGVMAKPAYGNDAIFVLDETEPQAYGVIIPTTNLYSTMSVFGYNQGDFDLMGWQAPAWPAAPDLEVNDAGDDISKYYPQFFGGIDRSESENGMMDPWDTQWLNVSAYDAENETLSSFTLTKVWNEYSMQEGDKFRVPMNSSIPVRVKILIRETGPKVLGFDFLSGGAPALNNHFLVGPDGKEVDQDKQDINHGGIGGGTIRSYIAFVAKTTGTYELLLDMTNAVPSFLALEFLSRSIKSISLDSLAFIGHNEEFPSQQDQYDNRWNSDWIKISGNKGDKIRLDVAKDYCPGAPQVDIWIPTKTGYELVAGAGFGSHLLYFPVSGSAYVSITETDYDNIGRYVAYATKVKPIDYKIGQDTLLIKLSRDEVKAVDFTIKDDSFVRFNFTRGNTGNPILKGLTTNWAFIYQDSNSMTGYNIISALTTKTIDTRDYLYYYLPAGDYEAVIENTDKTKEGFLEIDSLLINSTMPTIPITNTSYSVQSPSEFLTLQFGPDGEVPGLKNATWAYLNITQPGDYYLQTDVTPGDNPEACVSEFLPSHVVVYNASAAAGERYTDFTNRARVDALDFPAFSEDGGTNNGDRLLIAYPRKWHDLTLNFSAYANPQRTLNYYRGNDGVALSTSSDTTTHFTANGTVELTFNTNYNNWARGLNLGDFDVAGINPDDYYWLRIQTTGDYGTQVPKIQRIRLSNSTLTGDVNIPIVGPSQYEFADFWDIADLAYNNYRVNQIEPWGTNVNKPAYLGHVMSLEPGLYKALLIPKDWDYDGNLTVNFALTNNATEGLSYDYNPVNQISVRPWNMNYTTFGYGLSTGAFNRTLYNNGLINITIKCNGSAYNWTQLVVSVHNITGYNVFIRQDLPWIANSPNNELKAIEMAVDGAPTPLNNTWEFGVLANEFWIIIEITGTAAPDDLIGVDIGVSQYWTTQITVEKSGPLAMSWWDEYGTIFLWILIPGVAVGVGIGLFFLIRKRHRGF